MAEKLLVWHELHLVGMCDVDRPHVTCCALQSYLCFAYSHVTGTITPCESYGNTYFGGDTQIRDVINVYLVTCGMYCSIMRQFPR